MDLQHGSTQKGNPTNMVPLTTTFVPHNGHQDESSWRSAAREHRKGNQTNMAPQSMTESDIGHRDEASRRSFETLDPIADTEEYMGVIHAKLYEFDEKFMTKHGRLPTEAEKEPVRHLQKLLDKLTLETKMLKKQQSRSSKIGTNGPPFKRNKSERQYKQFNPGDRITEGRNNKKENSSRFVKENEMIGRGEHMDGECKVESQCNPARADLEAYLEDIRSKIKRFDHDFKKKHGRLPTQQEKVPIRHLYRIYLRVKLELKTNHEDTYQDTAKTKSSNIAGPMEEGKETLEGHARATRQVSKNGRSGRNRNKWSSSLSLYSQRARNKVKDFSKRRESGRKRMGVPRIVTARSRSSSIEGGGSSLESREPPATKAHIPRDLNCEREVIPNDGISTMATILTSSRRRWNLIRSKLANRRRIEDGPRQNMQGAVVSFLGKKSLENAFPTAQKLGKTRNAYKYAPASKSRQTVRETSTLTRKQRRSSRKRNSQKVSHDSRLPGMDVNDLRNRFSTRLHNVPSDEVIDIYLAASETRQEGGRASLLSEQRSIEKVDLQTSKKEDEASLSLARQLSTRKDDLCESGSKHGMSKNSTWDPDGETFEAEGTYSFVPSLRQKIRRSKESNPHKVGLHKGESKRDRENAFSWVPGIKGKGSYLPVPAKERPQSLTRQRSEASPPFKPATSDGKFVCSLDSHQQPVSGMKTSSLLKQCSGREVLQESEPKFGRENSRLKSESLEPKAVRFGNGQVSGIQAESPDPASLVDGQCYANCFGCTIEIRGDKNRNTSSPAGEALNLPNRSDSSACQDGHFGYVNSPTNSNEETDFLSVSSISTMDSMVIRDDPDPKSTSCSFFPELYGAWKDLARVCVPTRVSPLETDRNKIA